MIQILIVDDEKPICDLIQMSLTREGYHCTCAWTSCCGVTTRPTP